MPPVAPINAGQHGPSTADKRMFVSYHLENIR